MYEIRLGDCYSMLDEWPSSAALLTDPPWGMGYRSHHNTAPGRDHLQRKDGDFDPIVGDDRPFDPAPFLRFRWICLWGAQHFADALPASRQWLVWDKLAGKTPCDAADVELAWTNQDGPPRIRTHLWRGIMRAGEENVSRQRKLHPHQTPVAIWSWVLEVMEIPPGTLVLDPFAGSASLGKACIRRGLDYLGVEIDPRYWQVASDGLLLESARVVLA